MQGCMIVPSLIFFFSPKMSDAASRYKKFPFRFCVYRECAAITFVKKKKNIKVLMIASPKQITC